jgi:hypothetical protein
MPHGVRFASGVNRMIHNDYVVLLVYDAQDGHSMFLRIVSAYLGVDTASQPRTTIQSTLPPWEPHISQGPLLRWSAMNIWNPPCIFCSTANIYANGLRANSFFCTGIRHVISRRLSSQRILYRDLWLLSRVLFSHSSSEDGSRSNFLIDLF